MAQTLKSLFARIQVGVLGCWMWTGDPPGPLRGEDHMGTKRYLGDSVYVDVEDGMLKLTTENGYPDDPRNVIYLEPEVFQALTVYVASLAAAQAARPAPR